MRKTIDINRAWTCTMDGMSSVVDLPHTPVTLPLHYFTQDQIHRSFSYEKELDLTSFKGNKVLAVFEGISSQAKAVVNGRQVAEHKGAYLPFRINLSDYAGSVIALRLDCSSEENPDIPPFGGRMDYLSFLGIYREAKLLILDHSHIQRVRVSADEKRRLHIKTELSAYPAEITYNISLKGDVKYSFTETLDRERESVFDCPEAELWSIEKPNLYTLEARAFDDAFTTTFGFRTAEFRADAFYLNGKKVKLIGADRHQSYPYVGYAMPGSFQRDDARKLKEMGMNLVRTSHYPDHPDFLDECDRIGLLVFEEIPGWQHISRRPIWRELTVRNTHDMIERDYNHPSIVLWGVRINESPDDDELYSLTNKVAHEMDRTRQTGGVRCIRKSHLLEDVYTFNDFSHMETNQGFLDKELVTDKSNPYLITEFGGHIYPTKRYDDEQHRLTHALRTATCVNHMLATEGISGCIAWCFSDYNTHEDFGSGDLICYHGLTDSFRIPKLAYHLYRSQLEDKPVMEVSSLMNPGDHTRLCIKEIAIFTNADYVEIANDGKSLGRFFPDRKTFPALKHAPIRITWDLIYRNLEGTFLQDDAEEREAFAKRMYDYALTSWTTGMDQFKTYFEDLSIKFNVSVEEISRIFGTRGEFYMNGRTDWTFTAFKDGKAVKKMSFFKGQKLELRAEYDRSPIRLDEESSFQVRQINLLAVLENTDVIAPYLFEPFEFKADGSVELYGSPRLASMEGGALGVYIRTNGRKGAGSLTISSERFGSRTIEFEVV